MIGRVRPVPVLAFARMDTVETQEALLIEEADVVRVPRGDRRRLRRGRDEVEPWAWARLNQRLRAVDESARGFARLRRRRSQRTDCYLRGMRTEHQPDFGQADTGAETYEI